MKLKDPHEPAAYPTPLSITRRGGEESAATLTIAAEPPLSPIQLRLSSGTRYGSATRAHATLCQALQEKMLGLTGVVKVGLEEPYNHV